MADTDISLNTPQALDAIFGLVAEGEHSLGDIAKALGIKRRDLVAWLSRSEDNKKLYDRAVAVGESARRERILGTLERIAFLDVSECYDPKTGGMMHVTKMPRHARMAVHKLKQKEFHYDGKPKPGTVHNDPKSPGTVIQYEVEFYNRIDAIKLLGAELRMFVEKHEHTLANPYQATMIPVTPRLADPDKISPPAVDAEFTEVNLDPLS